MSDNNCKKMLKNYNNIALTWLITAAKNDVIDLSNTNKISGNFNPEIEEKIKEFNNLLYGNSKLDLNIEPYKIMLLKNKKEINFGIFNNIENMNESTIKKIAKELKNCKNIWNLVCVPGIKSQILSNLCEAGKNNKPTYNDSSSSTMAKLATATGNLGSSLGSTLRRNLSNLDTFKRAFGRFSKKKSNESATGSATGSAAELMHTELGGKKSRKKRKKLKRKKSKKYKKLY